MCKKIFIVNCGIGKENLTNEEKNKICEATEKIKKLFGSICNLIYSGSKRSWQAVNQARGILCDLDTGNPLQRKDLCFEDKRPFLSACEIVKIKNEAGSVFDVLKISANAKEIRQLLKNSIINLCGNLDENDCAVIFSETECLLLAAPEVTAIIFPFKLDVGGIVKYTVEEKKITSTKIL
jgi:hypothetical protein